MTERNTRESTRGQTQRWETTMLGLSRVRKIASQNKDLQFSQLTHHISEELLEQGFYSLKKKAAKGVDGVSWNHYEQQLESNLSHLYHQIQRGSYRPKPARRVYIEKADGSQRPLSIQCLEDKIVQQAVMLLLNQIYEEDFLCFSYGFRKGKSQHDALDALTYSLNKRKVNWVLDLDIRQFFDTVQHDWLIRMVEHRIKDRRLVKLIERWIKVGVVEEGKKRQAASIGIPQGAIISPLLANIYLHYVFDLWSHQWRKCAEGDTTIIRYADDGVVCFQRREEAESYLRALSQRLSKFGLAVHPDKTRLIRFGRFARKDCARYGLRKPETFDFLGFTHYCTKRQDGSFKVGRRTIRKRLRKQIKAVQRELRKRMHEPIGVTVKWLRSVLTGHMNYYGVPGNWEQLSLFKDEIVTRWFKMLRRRSQRYRLTWDRFGPWVRKNLPKVRIVHPYPEQRFCARYSK